MLPLSNEQMLEVLVTLRNDENPEVSSAACATIDTLDPASFITLAGDAESPAEVLAFLCAWPRATREVVEAAVFNRATPDEALTFVAARSQDPNIVEAISLKQQSLIRSPEIIEAILANPGRTPEAERRALEVRAEFFDKQFGANMVAGEQRVRAEADLAARPEQQPVRDTVSISGIDDLIRLGLIEADVDDSVLTEYEEEFGPFDARPPSPEQQIDIEQMVTEVVAEQEGLSPERMPIFQQVALMSIKDRVMLAIKGTREARTILVRDANRIVASAVMRNPRLTDTEVEQISSIKTVPEDVLRQIGQTRAWTRSYTVIHNLVRNPRTPIAISLGFLNRIQTRDMRALSLNKNIPDVIRTTSARMYIKRSSS